MRAVIHRTYGSPAAIEVVDIEPPRPASDEVAVRVEAASINEWDWARLHGTPLVNRLSFGLRHPRPRHRILGCDVAGRIEAVGSAVVGASVGDRVFGDLSAVGWSGFADRVCAPVSALAPIPPSLSAAEAAALPQAGMLALQALDRGGIGAGRRVLINGGGGGVGSIAIPLARSLGAEVTAVDLAAKHRAMLGLGATHVIDHEAVDPFATGATYDLVIDVMALRSPRTYRAVLAPGGTAVLVGGPMPTLVANLLLGRRGDRRVILLAYRPSRPDLIRLGELCAAGVVAPVIHRTFPLEDAAAALRCYGEGGHVGKIVLTMGE